MTKAETSCVRTRFGIPCAITQAGAIAIALFVGASFSGAAEAAQVVITSGTSWTVPSDWTNSGSSIDCVGGGASGASGTAGTYFLGGNGGVGGGGGAFARKNNAALTPGSSVSIAIGGVGGDTSFGGLCVAKGASGPTGGQASASTGDVKFSGGNGGAASAGSEDPGYVGGAGGGGGGAAGSHGAGNSASASIGGQGDSTFGGAGGGANSAGAIGSEYGSVGSGGGGGGGGGGAGTHGSVGQAGGRYGSGGGGGGGGGGFGGFGGDGASGAGAAGQPGLIVITYTPAPPPPPPPPTATGARTSSFAYDVNSGQLIQEVIEPDQPAFRLQTDYTNGGYGNRRAATISGADIATRTATNTFEGLGRFQDSSTNALGQTETYQYDERFGQPTSHTGPNGLTTTWAYDGFGRKTLETRADGTKTTWSYQFCSGVNGGTAACPAGGKYFVTETPLAANGTQIGSIITAYFDQFGRPIASDAQGFNGAVIRSATQYDALGRVSYKSRPYYVATDTPRWESYTYDILGRRTLETYPDTTTTQFAYHGLSQTDTNALSQTRTTVKNSQGQTVSLTDTQSHTTTYKYGPFGNLVKVTDAVGNVTISSYDLRGRKIAASDPDLGVSASTYNVLDQVVSQTDAKGQTTTVSYDLLGRTTQRSEPDLVSSWTYDVGAKAIGKLSSASTNTGYQRSFTYDALGRPSQTQYTVGTASYSFTTSYDSASRLSGVAYPSGMAVTYGYNSFGYQTTLTNNATSEVYWTANARDAEQHLLQRTAGNGVVTNQSFNANTGRLTSVTSAAAGGTAGSVSYFSYGYDSLGQLTNRTDANSGLNETFTYDPLNRLASATVGQSLAKAFTYDSIGNLTSKSGVGTYVYPTAGQLRPHAVASISGTLNTTFTYDANGNQVTGGGVTYAYSSYNKPTSITRGASTISFKHDPDHQRYQQVSPSGTTTYLAAGGAMAERFDGNNGVTQWNNYLVAGGELIGMRVERTNETIYTRYFDKDHLGSIAVITNEAGVVTERLSYDAWGKRRFADGTDDVTGSIVSQTNRGFTGHEELADVALVHMNGRVYDPLLGRFGSADPMTENPMSTQGWNRYSYVGNSPLNFTDPSGYCFLGCFWKPIFNAIGNFFKAIGNLFKAIPILGNLLQIAAMAILCVPGAVVCGALVAGLSSSFIAGVTGGRLGDILKAGLIAAVTVVAMNVVGDMASKFGSAAYAANVAGRAAVSCASSVASGGDCGSAALAGGISSAAAPLIGDLAGGNRFGGALASGAVGGLASVAGGGKFGNGAVTAAFGYLMSPSVSNGNRDPMDANAQALAGCALGVAGCAVGGAITLGQILGPILFGTSAIGAAGAGAYAISQSQTDTDDQNVLYHYTTAAGMAGILSSGQMSPSLLANNPKDARSGDGQYFTDIVPGTKTSGQLAYIFTTQGYNGYRYTNYIGIDVAGLNVVMGRPHVFVVPNSGPLNISDRVRSFGTN